MVGRKKQQHEEEGNTERWLVSYADFITLLFAFFTTLYAISTVDAQKMGKMVTSMRASFDSAVFDSGSRTLSLSHGSGGAAAASMPQEILLGLTLPKGTNIKDLTLRGMEDLKSSSSAKRQVLSGEKALGRLKRSVETLLGADVLKGLVRVHVESRGLVISLGEGGIFDSGSDQIKPEGKAMLDTIATSLVSLGNDIRVEGHTDNVPINNSRFPSNWELSTARATAVVSHLISKFGMQPDLLSAAGYAEYRPAFPNDSMEGRARNRRVDIVVLNPAAAQVEPR
jgi:chemotaxis protein MotB